MVRLIVKSPYVKGAGVGGYLQYIGTHIISLKREDAERLGYDHAPQWRSLLRAHRNEIAEVMHIPPAAL